MAESTGVLEIATAAGTRSFEWNGNPPDREAARLAFEQAMSAPYMLAIAFDGPHHGTTVRSFSEVETIEREQGRVSVQVTPALQGG